MRTRYSRPVDINGETYKVELVTADNESDNSKGITAAQNLVSSGVSIVLGSYGSAVSIAAGDVFKEAGMPALGITCTNPQVTKGNPVYFRTCFLDPFQGTVLANFAYENGARKAYCLSKLGDDYSVGLVKYFVEAFEKLGGKVVEEQFPKGNSDFTSYGCERKSERLRRILLPGIHRSSCADHRPGRSTETGYADSGRRHLGLQRCSGSGKG